MQSSLKSLPHVASKHYKILKKGAGIVTLNMTLIQMRILYLLGALLEKREMAHLVVVKPRQIMSTTAFNAAEFQFSQQIEGLRTLIITHRGVISTEIFESLKRFQDGMPPELKMETTRNNDYKLAWRNQSEIQIGVAGSDSARGFPCLILHLSEAGRYKNRHVMDIQEGAMNAHASAEKGNIILPESTSGGEGNWFHEIAKSGWKNPKSSWFTTFFAWWEMPDYRMTPPKGWAPDSEEIRLMDAINKEIERTRPNFPKVTIEQIYWRHVKLHQHMRSNLTGFMREFPSTFEEAFSSAEGRLIDSVVLNNCLDSHTMIDRAAARVLGVDPAGKGDRTALVIRQGYVLEKAWHYNRMDDVSLANIILKVVADEEIDHVFIDMGYGHGTYHLVRSLNFFNITGVHFGSTPDNKALYFNKRAEMAGLFQDWCEEGPDGMGGTARITNHAELIQDIKMIPDLIFSGDGQKFKLATKEEIKEELGKSPDYFDATILTFAAPVRSRRLLSASGQMMFGGQQQPNSMLTTVNDFNAWGQQQGGGQQQFNAGTKFYSFGNQGGNQ